MRLLGGNLQRAGCGNATINANLKAVNALLNSAARHFPECHFRPPRLPRLPEAPPPDRTLSRAELWRIHQALCHKKRGLWEHPETANLRRRHLGDLFLLCFLTGARQSELLNLQWSAISNDFDSFTLNATKTNDRRTLPLTPLVREIFDRRRDASRGNPAWPVTAVFPEYPSGKRNDSLARAGAFANVEYGRGAGIVNGWTLHTLRHTATTVMLHGGADFPSVRAVLGHSAGGHQSMTYRYAHANLESMRSALLILDQHWLEACREFDGATLKSLPILTKKAR